MATASVFGLIGPFALLAVVGLNAVLLWRFAPALRRALLGAWDRQLVVSFAPDGESNVILFPLGRGAALSPARVPVLRAA